MLQHVWYLLNTLENRTCAFHLESKTNPKEATIEFPKYGLLMPKILHGVNSLTQGKE